MNKFITIKEIEELFIDKRITRDFKVNNFVCRLSFGYYQEFNSDVITFDIKINNKKCKEYNTIYALPINVSNRDINHIYTIVSEVFYSVHFCDICGEINICIEKNNNILPFSMNLCPCCEDDVDKEDFKRANLNLFQYYINRTCSKDFYKIK